MTIELTIEIDDLNMPTGQKRGYQDYAGCQSPDAKLMTLEEWRVLQIGQWWQQKCTTWFGVAVQEAMAKPEVRATAELAAAVSVEAQQTAIDLKIEAGKVEPVTEPIEP